MKNCGNCNRFDKVTDTLGICTDTGETVGVSNSCKACDEKEKATD